MDTGSAVRHSGTPSLARTAFRCVWASRTISRSLATTGDATKEVAGSAPVSGSAVQSAGRFVVLPVVSHARSTPSTPTS